jgi:hypothetical protein
VNPIVQRTAQNPEQQLADQSISTWLTAMNRTRQAGQLLDACYAVHEAATEAIELPADDDVETAQPGVSHQFRPLSIGAAQPDPGRSAYSQ